MIEGLLTIAGDDAAYPWLYSVIPNYTQEDKVIGSQLSLTSIEFARKFEKEFDEKLVESNCEKEKIGEIVIDFKS